MFNIGILLLLLLLLLLPGIITIIIINGILYVSYYFTIIQYKSPNIIIYLVCHQISFTFYGVTGICLVTGSNDMSA